MSRDKDLSFDMEQQFQNYLDKVKLKKENMSVVQYSETKRAFFGALGQLMVVMKEGVGDIETEAEAIAVMEDMERQVGKFWARQT